MSSIVLSSLRNRPIVLYAPPALNSNRELVCSFSTPCMNGILRHMRKPKRQLPEEIRQMFVKWGRQGGRKGASAGGKARAAKLSPERQREIMANALRIRWKKYRAAKKKKEATP